MRMICLCPVGRQVHAYTRDTHLHRQVHTRTRQRKAVPSLILLLTLVHSNFRLLSQHDGDLGLLFLLVGAGSLSDFHYSVDCLHSYGMQALCQAHMVQSLGISN